MDVFILDLSSAGIEGECGLEGYERKIEILSYSLGVASSDAGKGADVSRGSGNPDQKGLTVTKYVDYSSCQIIDFCNQAKNIPTAILTIGQNSGGKVQKLVAYTLVNVLVSSVTVDGGGGEKPRETVTFTCSAISVG